MPTIPAPYEYLIIPYLLKTPFTNPAPVSHTHKSQNKTKIETPTTKFKPPPLRQSVVHQASKEGRCVFKPWRRAIGGES